MDMLIKGASGELFRVCMDGSIKTKAKLVPNPLCRVLHHAATNEMEVIASDDKEKLSDGFIEERWQQFEWEDRDISDEPLADFVAMNDRYWTRIRTVGYEIYELQGGE